MSLPSIRLLFRPFLLCATLFTLLATIIPILMSSSAGSKLFTAIKVGNVNLAHRIVLAPLTRYRANSVHVHGDLAVEYYAQRASAPGSLLITEATFIAQRAGGYAHVPGIWNDDQVKAWKKVRTI